MTSAESGPTVPAHTPGPWIYKNGYHVWAGRDADECIVDVWGARGDPREVHANARLIAAAPELLALAKQYARECLECGGTGRDSRYVNCTDLPLDFLCCDECSDIWAVINKAEGRADHER